MRTGIFIGEYIKIPMSKLFKYFNILIALVIVQNAYLEIKDAYASFNLLKCS